MKYKQGDFARLRYGCVWLFCQIDKVEEEIKLYEVSYGTRKRYNLVLNNGWPFDYWCHAKESDLKPIKNSQ